MKKDVEIVEVAPRDGLQSESKILSVQERIDFIDALATTGLTQIEAGSFVKAEQIPQLEHSGDVIAGIKRPKDTSYTALVPNIHGFKEAIKAKVNRIALFTATSDTFTKKNIRCTVEESLDKYQEVATLAKTKHIPIRGYVSCIFACPYEGLKTPAQVVPVVEEMLSLGCEEISLGDTTGVGTIQSTRKLLQVLLKSCQPEQLAVHFHDTYGQALTNIYVALEHGIRTVDAAVSGIGGCPYAKGASGNVATEDVIYLLEGNGLKTGVDLNKLIAVGQQISQIFERNSQSKVSLAKG